jgi:hypothetical protein
MSRQLEDIAAALVAGGKGILAADETVPTLTKRFDTLGITSTEQAQRIYREMLFSVQDDADFISGVILQDETIRQARSDGTPFADFLARRGIIPASKSIFNRNIFPVGREKQSPRGPTICATVSRPITALAPGSRSGERSYASPMPCQAARA